MTELYIAEIFDSIQGEGPYIGTRQLFIRLAGCNLRCNYCDTAWSWKKPDSFTIEIGDFNKTFKNPISVDTLASQLLQILPDNLFAISITGGEPLTQAQPLKDFFTLLNNKFKILLETNGTLAKELTEVLPWTDIISMDIKLPKYSEKNLLETHKEFLKIAVKKYVYVKLVTSGIDDLVEIQQALDTISQVSSDIPLIIQPLATAEKKYEFCIEELSKLQTILLNTLSDVRVIPQMHKLVGIR